jgi:RNA polymerase sigma factor (sigma-70 family)
MPEASEHESPTGGLPDLPPTMAFDGDWQRLSDRLAKGDRDALGECLQATSVRLSRLARQMLTDFPTVRRWADTDDVLQNTLMRLYRVLKQWTPDSREDFFQMAATQMRRALLDLARFYCRREKAGLRGPGDPVDDVPEQVESSSEMRRWQSFHEAVERLPAQEREVVALQYYHDWPVRQIAEFLKISERTVIRRWQAALWKIAKECGLDDAAASRQGGEKL